MANIPAPQKDIGDGMSMPFLRVAGECANPFCDRAADHVHHIVRRSYLGGKYEAVQIYGRLWPNIVGLCQRCHLELVEKNQAQIWALDKENKYIWREKGVSEFLNPHPVLNEAEAENAVAAGSSPDRAHTDVGRTTSASLSSGDGDAPGGVSAPSPDSHCLHTHLEPGQECPDPGCDYSRPHPRRKSSPKSEISSFRSPLGTQANLRERWQNDIKKFGLEGRKYAMWHLQEIYTSLSDGLSDDVAKALGKEYGTEEGPS